MSKVAPVGVVLLAACFFSGCVADTLGDSCGTLQTGVATGFAPDPDDEVLDATDPPVDPDPVDEEDEAADQVAYERNPRAYEADVAAAEADDVEEADDTPSFVEGCTAWTEWGVKKKKKKKHKKHKKHHPGDSPTQCVPRSEQLSPKGLTFVIHVSKHYGDVAIKQLQAVRQLIRPRDIFFIQQKEEVVQRLRAAFPCNQIHFMMRHPSDFPQAVDAAPLVEGISVDWESWDVLHKSAGWSVDQLSMWAGKVREQGKTPSFIPFWPGGFNDGAITRKTGMKFELAQIQNRCAQAGPDQFASVARSLITNFNHEGLGPRDVGFEISLNSFASTTNHVGVDRAAMCTRKAYGKGARAIYLFGNGFPHLDDYFRKIKKMGLRK